jgi:hypothetical protein
MYTYIITEENQTILSRCFIYYKYNIILYIEKKREKI